MTDWNLEWSHYIIWPASHLKVYGPPSLPLTIFMEVKQNSMLNRVGGGGGV